MSRREIDPFYDIGRSSVRSYDPASPPMNSTSPSPKCHAEGYKCLGDPLAEALGDSMVATDRNYSWRDLDPGYHHDLLYRAERVRKSLANRGLAVAGLTGEEPSE